MREKLNKLGDKKVITNKAFKSRGNADVELNQLYLTIDQLIRQKGPSDDIKIISVIDLPNQPEREKNCYYFERDQTNSKNCVLYHIDNKQQDLMIPFAQHVKDATSQFLESNSDLKTQNTTITRSQEQFKTQVRPYLASNIKIPLYHPDPIPNSVLNAFIKFYHEVAEDFNQDPKIRRHYKGNAKLVQAMNHLAEFMLKNTKPTEPFDPENPHKYYTDLHNHFLAVDKAAKHYQSNNTPTIWVVAAAVLTAILLAAAIATAAALTFMTAGLALPLTAAAVIGISAGASAGGAAIGALVGGLGMYHGKVKHFKQDMAPKVSEALGKPAGVVALHVLAKQPEGEELAQYANSFIIVQDKTGKDRSYLCRVDNTATLEIYLPTSYIRSTEALDNALNKLKKAQNLPMGSKTLHVSKAEIQELFYSSIKNNGIDELTEEEKAPRGLASALEESGHLAMKK